MALSVPEISKLARVLDQAMLNVEEVERLTVVYPDLSLSDAYLVQEEGIRMRLGRGERQIGMKMGLTSTAKQEQMGLRLPIYGVLTDKMRVSGGKFSMAESIHPKIEPEIAFMVSRELKGRVSYDEAVDAVSGVCAAMEILDSRFVGFKYFSLPDVVADNCSSAYFVQGDVLRKPRDLDLANLEMTMKVDGKVVQSARASAISGDPVNSILHLCELLAQRGLSLKAGSLVLAGAATVAVQLEPGQRVTLDVEELGQVAVDIKA